MAPAARFGRGARAIVTEVWLPASAVTAARGRPREKTKAPQNLRLSRIGTEAVVVVVVVVVVAAAVEALERRATDRLKNTHGGRGAGAVSTRGRQRFIAAAEALGSQTPGTGLNFE